MSRAASQVRHVHIGAGKLGLGLVCDISRRLGLQLVLCNRESLEARHVALRKTKRYKIQYEDGDSSEVADFDYHSFPTHQSQLTSGQPVVRAIADPTTMLLTVAVGEENLISVAPLIARGLVERALAAGGGPSFLFIVACENSPRASEIIQRDVFNHVRRTKPELVAAVGGRVHFCNSVVDRICPEQQTREDAVVVVAEKHCEWIIEMPEGDDADRLQAVLPVYVTIVPREEYEAYVRKKFWCMNAIHLGVAVYARERNIPLLAEAIEDPEIERRTLLLQKEMGLALYLFAEGRFDGERFSLREIERYNTIILGRIRRSREDRTGRIIREVLKLEEVVEKRVAEYVEAALVTGGMSDVLGARLRGLLQSVDMSGFLGKVNARLCEPIRYLVEGGGPYQASLDVLLRIFALLEESFRVYRRGLDEWVPQHMPGTGQKKRLVAKLGELLQRWVFRIRKSRFLVD